MRNLTRLINFMSLVRFFSAISDYNIWSRLSFEDMKLRKGHVYASINPKLNVDIISLNKEADYSYMSMLELL